MTAGFSVDFDFNLIKFYSQLKFPGQRTLPAKSAGQNRINKGLFLLCVQGVSVSEYRAIYISPVIWTFELGIIGGGHLSFKN